MKNSLRKLLSLLLAVVMLLSLAVFSSAAQDEVTSGNEVVGKIYLCSRWSSITTTGHLWVYILNTSDEAYDVGLYNLQPDEGVSLATFGLTRYDGIGIYYNMEAYRNDKYCDESCISISDDLTRDELSAVSKKILSSNHWDLFNNCVYFACEVWNKASDKKIIPFFIPPVARLQIKSKGGNTPCEMEYQPPEHCFKHKGKGDGAYLQLVGQKSLDA